MSPPALSAVFGGQRLGGVPRLWEARGVAESRDQRLAWPAGSFVAGHRLGTFGFRQDCAQWDSKGLTQTPLAPSTR